MARSGGSYEIDKNGEPQLVQRTEPSTAGGPRDAAGRPLRGPVRDHAPAAEPKPETAPPEAEAAAAAKRREENDAADADGKSARKRK